MKGKSPNILKVQTDQIPDYIREDIGRTLFKSFMENIRDPEKLRQFNELGEAFMKRRRHGLAKTSK